MSAVTAAAPEAKPSPAPGIARTMNLVLTGASGYLGQHVLSHWIRKGVLPDPTDGGIRFRIKALYYKSSGFPEAVKRFREKHGSAHGGIADVVVRSVDLANPGDIRSVLGHDNNDYTIVVHAAALSNPPLCQENPEFARAINVPVAFLDAAKASGASIVALSTDQVYDGTQKAGSYYKEDEKDGLNPKNVYGQTKLELEGCLLPKQPQTSSSSKFVLLAALRSSIIIGPKAPIDEACVHEHFFDFCKSRGASGEPTPFYTNAYRSVVRTDKVVATIGGLVSKIVVGTAESAPNGVPPSSSSAVYNMGGPVRVNRVEMARAVFDKFGYDPELLLETELPSATSPRDTSMDSSLLFEEGILRNREMDVDAKTYLKDLADYVFDTKLE